MISLIGKEHAKEGNVFLFYGSNKECQGCRFKSTCIDSLEEGRKYIITEVKDVEQKCLVHESGKVQVVEVEKSYITALIDSKIAFEGSVIHYEPISCDNTSFEDLCSPEGLKKGDKCKIIKNCGKFEEFHKNGQSLNKVVLKVLE